MKKCIVCGKNATFRIPVDGDEYKSKYVCSQECLNKRWLLSEAEDVFVAIVQRVVDGDTLVVTRVEDNEKLRIRTVGIDAPELKQDYGKQSTEMLRKLVPRGSEVYVVSHGLDVYKRVLGDVYTKSGTSITDEMIASGSAWHYKKYNKDKYLAKLETNARKRKLGLWANPNAIKPSDFRRSKK